MSAAEAAVLISIDKSSQHMSVSVDGVKRYSWPVSTGRSGYGTPSGSYTPFRLEEDHYSKEWDDAPMPHSIFFTPKGHAIHGSYETKRLGSAASHGCVRLAPKNAAILFSLVKEQGLGNTKVVLRGEAPPMIARRPAQREAEPMQLRQYRSPYATSERSYGMSQYETRYPQTGYDRYDYRPPAYVQPQYPSYRNNYPY